MKTISVTKAASKGIVMGKAFLVVQQNLEADKKLIQKNKKFAKNKNVYEFKNVHGF